MRSRVSRSGRHVVVASLAAVLLAGCTSAISGGSAATRGSAATHGSHAATSASAVGSPTPSAPSPSPSPKPTPKPVITPVHIRLFGSDGQTYGVGMPLMAYFSKRITNSAAFEKATTVTVNGTPANGAWYFEASALMSGYPLEAHYRPQTFWPAHTKIELNMPTAGLSAGPRLAYDDSLTLSWKTGMANILSVNGAAETLTVMSDGKLYGRFPTSLGAPRTPTLRGTKVIMEQDRNERMIGPGYDEIVPWSLRLTNSGEFLHAAPWNIRNIGRRSTSNGCTNLIPADAARLFDYLQIGDPVTYTNVSGPTMKVWDGYGDWNVSWASWKAGGAVHAS
jgi:lipoprotein-anchoring transpeptidase ErfK/SrfK